MSMAGKVWKLHEIRVSWEAAGVACSVKVRTDRPGGSMGDRATMPLAVTAQKTDSYPLDGITAKQLSTAWVQPAGAQLTVYDAVILGKPLGLHLDHPNGQTYETEPITLGA